MSPSFQQQSPGVVAAQTAVQGKQIDPLFRVFDKNTPLPEFFEAIFFTAIAVGATLAVLRLGYAGFMYMASDLWTSKERARTIIQEVMLGILLLLSIWVILKQINPELLNLNILKNAQPISAEQKAAVAALSNTSSGSTDTAPVGDLGSAPVGSWCVTAWSSGNTCYKTQEACKNKNPTVSCDEKKDSWCYASRTGYSIYCAPTKQDCEGVWGRLGAECVGS